MPTDNLPARLPPTWRSKRWALGKLYVRLEQLSVKLENGDPDIEKDLADIGILANHLAGQEIIRERMKTFWGTLSSPERKRE